MNNFLKLAQDAGLGELDENNNWFGFNQSSIKLFAELIAKAKAEELATALEKGPINDTAASIAIWIRQQ